MRPYLLLLSMGCLLAADTVPLRELSAEETRAVDAAVPSTAPAKPRQPRRLLVVNMARRDGKPIAGHPSIPLGNRALETMGQRTGAWSVTLGNEESSFRPENLSPYDAIVFNSTSGVLFDDPALRQSLLNFVKAGKGFVGIHAAASTFVQYPKYDQFPEFGVMLGGYEDGGHPWKPTETTHIKVDDAGSPLTAMFKGPFTIEDEGLQFREPQLRDRLHVLLSIDAAKMDTGPQRHILKQRQGDLDFPVSWIKRYGSGRVFFTAMGHNSSLFTRPDLMQHLLAGIQYALGDLPADDAPSAQGRAR